jgi:hypothetical protein
MCSPGRIRPGLRTQCAMEVCIQSDDDGVAMSPPLTRLASLGGADECIRPYTLRMRIEE